MSVLFTFCATLLSWVFPSTSRTQQALQWWHQQQVHRLHEGAELIRDGMLQELFAIRRGLELANDNPSSSSHDQIRQLEELHRQLEEVSNQLSPAFVRDSLPLAFQHVIQQWIRQHPKHTVLSHLTKKTQCPMTARGHVALTVLEELFFVVSDHLEAGGVITVDLSDKDDSVTLGITIGFDAVPCQCRAIAQLREVAYLRESFEFLTQGRAYQKVHQSAIEWRFTWRSES